MVDPVGWRQGARRIGASHPPGGPLPANQLCYPCSSQLMKRRGAPRQRGGTSVPPESRRAQRGMLQRALAPSVHTRGGPPSTIAPAGEKPAEGSLRTTASQLTLTSRAGRRGAFGRCLLVCRSIRKRLRPGPRGLGPAGRSDAPSGGSSRRSPLGSTAR